MSANETFDDLERQYFTIKSNFNRLLFACQTDDQRNELRAAYANSRDNYNKAMNQIFDDNDTAIDALRSELSNSQQQIEDSLTNLQEISKVIDTITAAVSVGTRLVAISSGA